MKKQIFSFGILLSVLSIVISISCKKDDNNNAGGNPPIPDFTVSTTSGTAPLEVNFTDISQNTPTLWQWDFGDGSTVETVQNPTHTYSINGTYSVSLTVSNAYGSSTETKTNYIYVGISNCPSSFTDARDGNVYLAVKIGNQCWMAENLAYLPAVFTSDSGSYTSPYYYVYDYQGNSVSAAKATSNYQTYGVLYNWPAVMDGDISSNSVPSGVQGVCPNGWHLPSDEEWKILEGTIDSQYGVGDPEWDEAWFRGFDAGGNLKETGTSHWLTPNTGATNSSGFAALPAGSRYYNGSFQSLGNHVDFWSSTEVSNSNAWNRLLSHSSASVFRGESGKLYGFSCRCLKD